MAREPQPAAIALLTGLLAVPCKNPKLRGATAGAAGSSWTRGTGGHRDGEGKQAGRFKQSLVAADNKPAQDKKDGNKYKSDDDDDHKSPPSSPKTPIRIK